MIKKDIKWLAWTVIVLIIVSIAQIYSKNIAVTLFTITLVSLIVWLIDSHRYRIHHRNYKEHKDQKKRIESDIHKLHEQCNSHKLERYEHNLEIIELKERLSKLDLESKHEIEKLEETITHLTQKTTKLNKVIRDSKEAIITLESKEHNLKELLIQKLKHLEHSKKHIEYEEIHKKLHQLELLWRYDPSWGERKGIESIVSLKNTHLPFTLTQAFISFDKLILAKVQKYDHNANGQNTNLFENIQFIIEEYHLPMHMQDELHQIRKARNRWFHDGIYPTHDVIESLIKLLHDVEAKVFL